MLVGHESRQKSDPPPARVASTCAKMLVDMKDAVAPQMPFKIEVADLEQRVDEEDNGVVAPRRPTMAHRTVLSTPWLRRSPSSRCRWFQRPSGC